MSRLLLYTALLTATACSHRQQPGVEDLTTHQALPQFRLASLRGTRDGDRLSAQAVYTDTSSILTIRLEFVIGSTTALESGSWRWTRTGAIGRGGVAAKSVDFLGGQSGAPSIGGTYELLREDGTPQYRVRIPLMELKEKLASAPDWIPM